MCPPVLDISIPLMTSSLNSSAIFLASALPFSVLWSVMQTPPSPAFLACFRISLGAAVPSAEKFEWR